MSWTELTLIINSFNISPKFVFGMSYFILNLNTNVDIVKSLVTSDVALQCASVKRTIIEDYIIEGVAD